MIKDSSVSTWKGNLFFICFVNRLPGNRTDWVIIFLADLGPHETYMFYGFKGMVEDFTIAHPGYTTIQSE